MFSTSSCFTCMYFPPPTRTTPSLTCSKILPPLPRQSFHSLFTRTSRNLGSLQSPQIFRRFHDRDLPRIAFLRRRVREANRRLTSRNYLHFLSVTTPISHTSLLNEYEAQPLRRSPYPGLRPLLHHPDLYPPRHPCA